MTGEFDYELTTTLACNTVVLPSCLMWNSALQKCVRTRVTEPEPATPRPATPRPRDPVNLNPRT